MTTERRRSGADGLKAEQRAAVEARRGSSRAREADVGDREAILEEHRQIGSVSTTGDPAWADDEVDLLRFLASLRDFRERSGLTLSGVAERSGIDQAALSRLEAGKGNPTASTLTRYCHAPDGRNTWGFDGAIGVD